MATIGTSYRVYTPGIPLNEQVEPKAPPTVAKIDMKRMITGAPPLTIKAVEFKPLQINDKLFNISLKSETTVDLAPVKGLLFYEKYTFTIKSQDGEISYPAVPVEEIEDTIGKIYASTKKGE